MDRLLKEKQFSFLYTEGNELTMRITEEYCTIDYMMKHPCCNGCTRKKECDDYEIVKEKHQKKQLAKKNRKNKEKRKYYDFNEY